MRKPLLTKNRNFYELYVLKNRSFYELLNRVNSCTSHNCWPNGRGSPKICISNDTKSNVTFGLNELYSLKSLFVNLFCSLVHCSIHDKCIWILASADLWFSCRIFKQMQRRIIVCTVKRILERLRIQTSSLFAKIW